MRAGDGVPDWPLRVRDSALDARSRHNKGYSGSAEMTETKTCPFCKSDIPKAASTCRHCGKEVSTAALLGKGLMGIGCGLMVLVPLAVMLFFVVAGSC